MCVVEANSGKRVTSKLGDREKMGGSEEGRVKTQITRSGQVEFWFFWGMSSLCSWGGRRVPPEDDGDKT